MSAGSICTGASVQADEASVTSDWSSVFSVSRFGKICDVLSSSFVTFTFSTTMLARRSSFCVPLSVFLATLAIAIVVPARAHPPKESTYTITSVLELVDPVDPAVMNDDFQDARVLSHEHGVWKIEVTTYPLASQTIGENPRWREEDAAMTEYLRATPAENWDEAMRADLLAELKSAGIDPGRLTDRALVEKVSAWAMRRAKSSGAFSVWCIYYPDGKPTVLPALRAAFDHEKPGPDWTDEKMFGQENLGKEMFYNRVHGSCTSSSIYLSTIFRALGIPTRVVFFIPPFDPNDAAQASLFYTAVTHHQVRETVRQALDGMHGFDNHLFNEVYIDHHWIRLNYSRLGQPILDAHYFGLLTHVYTCADMSQVPLAETWGRRYFDYRHTEPDAKLSSSNPYRLVSVSDHFGTDAHVDNPFVPPPAELHTVTIRRLLRPDSPDLPSWVNPPGKPPLSTSADFLLDAVEWLPGSHMQMRTFLSHATHRFVLTAPGHPDLSVTLTGGSLSQGDGHFQAYMAKIDPAARPQLVPGIPYTLHLADEPQDDSHQWSLLTDLNPVTFE